MRTLVALGLALALTSHTASVAEAPARQGVQAEWTFDHDGELEGWRPNSHLREVTVTNGWLRCRATGSDPILVLTTPFAPKASPWQYLEIRMRASRDGTCEWFWSNTTEGQYGGFSQDKSSRFQINGDGAWHTWRVFPFWHTEHQIVRLRFDVFDGAEFALDSIRVCELALPPTAPVPAFTFTNSTQGWQAVGECSVAPTPAGLAIRRAAAGGFVLGPPLTFDAEQRSLLSLHLAAARGQYATLLFATDASSGLHRFAFPLEPGAGGTTYNLDLLAAREWKGTIIALGLEPDNEPGAEVVLGSLMVGAEPQGPPQLKVTSFGPEEAMPRAGRLTWIQAVVGNSGATPATNVSISVRLTRDGEVLTNLAAIESLPRLGFNEQRHLRWGIRVDEPGRAEATIEVTSGNAPSLRTTSAMAFAAPLDLPKADCVPEPKPVRGPFEVGAYYFPGWRSAGQWQPIRDFPERRPVLGWYREGDPVVADWHIKWAVEHGITFFAYDWYWSKGARQLEHALHDGYFKARYRRLLKFCLLWANHNAPGTHSHADCLEVTRYWIANYFARPEHLSVEGKPVMIIFSPQRLTEDLGSDGVRAAFAAMRDTCRQAGLSGLYLLGCVGNVGEARRAAEEGYDAVTAYTWPGLGMSGDGMFAPYSGILEGYQRQWEHLRDEGGLPLLLPVCGGWDSRPWHGLNNLVRYGRTPALFQEHLKDARRFIEASTANATAGALTLRITTQKSEIRNPTSAPTALPLVLIEAWNEWGEGSYIEPHQERGFGYLDAIRAAFTDAPREHLDVTPADVGRGPYDIPPDPPGRTVWSFADSDDGWAAGMNLSEARVVDGILSARTAGSDPAFFSPPLHVVAADFGAIELRMRLAPIEGGAFDDHAQLFWRTRQLPESEAASVRFAVRADGAWHDYRIPVAGHARWRGVVTRLRLDPGSRSGVEVGLDNLRLTR